MIFLRDGLLGFLGLTLGMVTAAGVFALIAIIGLIPRMAARTHTGRYMQKYEWAIILGGSIGNFIYLYDIHIWGKYIPQAIFGLSSGIYVGCLVMSLAETLNVFPIMTRRLNIGAKIRYFPLALALGKGCGAFLFFLLDW